MDLLKNLVTVICAASLTYGAFIFLAPEGAMKKSIKLVVASAIIVSVLFSVKSFSEVDFELEFNNDESTLNSSLNEAVAIGYCKEIEDSIEELVVQQLKVCGVTKCVVSVFTDISDTGDIYISNVQITCPKDNIDTAQRLMASLGISAKIIEGSEN